MHTARNAAIFCFIDFFTLLILSPLLGFFLSFDRLPPSHSGRFSVGPVLLPEFLEIAVWLSPDGSRCLKTRTFASNYSPGIVTENVTVHKLLRKIK